jgi:ribosomal-protein-alanine N-acetyltransferase
MLLAAYLIGCGVAGESEILRIAVRPSFRRRGFGRKLMEYFLNVRKAKGDLTVFLEVRASNISAIALYESCGFRSYTVRRNYYKNPTEDAVMMNLYLGN